MKTDIDKNGRITLDEFEQISYVFSEDSFWDGYSIEEICQDEFDRADEDSNASLNFTEFKSVV